MSFCTNCGKELAEGLKFCPNCGAQVENTDNIALGNKDTSDFQDTKSQPVQNIQPANYNQSAYTTSTHQKPEETLTGIDRFGKYFGIVLLILAIIDFNSDPPIVTIILSFAIILGAIFCLGKKYRLKGFTIAAFILSAICLIFGVSQAKQFGILRTPRPEEYFAESSKVESNENGDNNETTEEKVYSSKEAEVNYQETTSADNTATEAKQDKSKETQNVGGVNPDLKAFLDSYEDFVDEYVSFMKEYNNDPSNAMTMLTEYSEFMQKYTDFAEQISQYDSQNMSTEDYKYYIEVTSRCSQKMLSVY